MSYNVREATTADGTALLDLWHGFTEHLSEFDTRYQHNESADERWLVYFENQLVDSKYGAVIVAEDKDSGELVGVLEARVMGNHPIFRLRNHGYIYGHYVTEAHRGEGVGSDLLNAAQEWFSNSSKDVDFYRVDTIEGDDYAAEFYEEKGFHPVEHVFEKGTNQGQ